MILSQKSWWLQVPHLTIGTLLLHPSWAGDMENSTCHQCLSTGSGLSSAMPQTLEQDLWVTFSSWSVVPAFWEQVLECCGYGRSSHKLLCLAAASVVAPSLLWCSLSPGGFCGLRARSASLAEVQQEPVPLSLSQPALSLSAASTMSVSAVEVCFTVTDIIALNFLRGCYQSVMDTLGKGAL